MCIGVDQIVFAPLHVRTYMYMYSVLVSEHVHEGHQGG